MNQTQSTGTADDSKVNAIVPQDAVIRKHLEEARAVAKQQRAEVRAEKLAKHDESIKMLKDRIAMAEEVMADNDRITGAAGLIQGHDSSLLKEEMQQRWKVEYGGVGRKPKGIETAIERFYKFAFEKFGIKKSAVDKRIRLYQKLVVEKADMAIATVLKEDAALDRARIEQVAKLLAEKELPPTLTDLYRKAGVIFDRSGEDDKEVAKGDASNNSEEGKQEKKPLSIALQLKRLIRELIEQSEEDLSDPTIMTVLEEIQESIDVIILERHAPQAVAEEEEEEETEELEVSVTA